MNENGVIYSGDGVLKIGGRLRRRGRKQVRVSHDLLRYQVTFSSRTVTQTSSYVHYDNEPLGEYLFCFPVDFPIVLVSRSKPNFILALMYSSSKYVQPLYWLPPPIKTWKILTTKLAHSKMDGVVVGAQK